MNTVFWLLLSKAAQSLRRALPCLISSLLAVQGISAEAGAAPRLLTLTPDDFVVDDQVVSDPSESIVDMEFNEREALLAWQDELNNLWVAQVDPVTGSLIPKNGKGVLIATGLVPITRTGNGPEWIETPEGMEIVFSLQAGRTTQLGRAWRVGSEWTYEALRNSRGRYNPYGSKDADDHAPRVMYIIDDVRRGRHVYWREIDDPTTETPVSEDTAVAPSWIDGARAMLTTETFEGVKQCAWYDIDSGEKSQISTGPDSKKFGRAWRAPEFDNAWVAVCANNPGSQIGVYMQSGATWNQIGTLLPPSGDSLQSIEYFVYGDRSYVFGVTTVGKRHNDIWLLGIDPASPFQRRVNANVPLDRRDPEVFITTQGPFIYYTERTGAMRGIVHRAATGLGPGR